MSYISQVLPSLLDGAAVTLQVFCIVIVLSIPIGAILAFLMQIKFKPLQWLLTLCVEHHCYCNLFSSTMFYQV